MRVAMVSGAGRGLGRAIAEHLGQQGWALSLGVRDLSQVADMTSETTMATRFDAQCAPDAQAWVDATIARFGRVDALVNNAGILRFVDFEQGTDADCEQDLDDLWAVNVKAPFRLIRAALPHLKASGAGRVVNIASTDSKRYRGGTSVGYVMVKHALHAMTQAVRFAGWDEGVRGTAICPGAIDTDLLAGLPGVTPKADRLTPQTVAQMVGFVLSMPNQASIPEFIANTRLESGL
ncbi:SDR family NAD(P)-dependent oxidoreductase [Roseicitreum antarcticum]|uniref:NADP-dependent 3-hydroxy acid dehydrogenase YdfG n=1 Tax=Roseicitreum antarcticum TaxID=564137 RepID=A0A1H2YZ21_9RHOB|nr:SDR family NAD(P)-dependent oxidoreductase [Roseicitreum antarcticum]SDX10356.1 NADP-dependent 3-hydroxy acid dehydrogenase YdfG [Roseicitreum antarcticum]